MNHKYLILILTLLITRISFAQKNIKTATFKVLGACEMCKERIETAVLDHKARTAKWDAVSQLLSVSYDPAKTSEEKILKAVADAGHDNERFKAADAIYQALPACCHYQRDTGPAAAKEKHMITGVVLEETAKGKINPISNATVKSLHSSQHFVTDSTGVFRLETDLPTHIAISYVGFQSDTISVKTPEMLTIILKNSSTGDLKEVIVSSRNPSTFVSTMSILNTLNMGAKELTKAACCNLSESFETSPSVDVSYSDAVTGVKQIQLLGLSGNYTQLLTENAPETKGLTAQYGLTYIPGPWIEGIQLTKGTGSVVNGYESIAGQINVEEKKPDNSEQLLVNAYVNTMGRLEANINTAHKLNDKWSMALLTHGNYSDKKIDHNMDGFKDLPTGSQWNVINRWKYMDNNGWIVQLALKALQDKRYAGQVDFDRNQDRLTTNHYGVGIDAEQYGFTGKVGYVFPRHKYKSLGLILSATQYSNDAYYGLTQYSGKQKNLYGNLIYQSIIGTTDHKFRTGFSFSNENYNETFNQRIFKRNEIVPGAFFEYTYTASDKFTAIAGLRMDHHNQYGFITTPRLHLKYDFNPKTNLRLSGGSGFRVSNLFAENVGVFVSARKYEILNPTTTYGYGLDPEKAWNYGLNFIHHFKLNNRNGSIALDAYQTRFRNQTVADMDADPQAIRFYNLKGRSVSSSIQAELNYELLRKLDLRMAYRWLEVQTQYNQGLLDKPFTAKHRAFINLAYETRNKWKFDYTTQWLSRKRIPNTASNPADKQMDAYSPSFFQMAAQVSKQFSKQWEVYIGGENLTNYVQEYRIIDAQAPFSPYFDGSLIWGPVTGRMVYAGFRFRIP
ncbi:TonB-dependent receptor domain-containing protein [Niabella beijingensis]|uniref:TonB-dependent receptor domain-containing protein n=1 Tax=Niabella beijingensis TaxID=2872700 RepID=UPI001CC1B863|nr:TonB-dependent receptor [Niabella beijingensis]MBZ4191872.1 TonB-dependent receptor [Niabella beijingensis]